MTATAKSSTNREPLEQALFLAPFASPSKLRRLCPRAQSQGASSDALLLLDAMIAVAGVSALVSRSGS
ncbi:hypothetical protein OG601_39205 [Streptomyces sp. NBC_01239]|uniref:hypothetical protein n=1 Tax=Streptomyces sp. NBC_01239 TaxID=2903792 RepID=UPI00225892D1|nr:hypothetical protein [Streptomyces sp. NBC_01239]MCX4816633.1 hypothetical protein [Streptomyces sp. NBC_01239]